MSIGERARTEAEKRFPVGDLNRPFHLSWYDKGGCRGFQEGAEWAASLDPTDAEVEAAARKVFETDAPSHEPHEWFDASEPLRSDYRATARAALAAARDAREDA